MSTSDPVMRAREPAGPPQPWPAKLAFALLMLFWIGIACEGVIDTVQAIISGAWVP